MLENSNKYLMQIFPEFNNPIKKFITGLRSIDKKGLIFDKTKLMIPLGSR